MTDESLANKSPEKADEPKNLFERIRGRFEPLGGIDLELPPREFDREPPNFNEIPGGHMQHSAFEIGGAFCSGGHRWRCTDIGTRIITAIKLEHDDDPSWYNGPPYAVAETVFDEYDIEGCTLEPEDAEPAVETDAADEDWDSPKGAARRIAQAKMLRPQARAGGLRFEAYLPSGLADWLLAHVERGSFRDPSEAVFVILDEHEEFEPHRDFRDELLKRRLCASMDDPRPGIPAEEVFERLKRKFAEPIPAPAVWRKRP